jgi:hypothetical protein
MCVESSSIRFLMIDRTRVLTRHKSCGAERRRFHLMNSTRVRYLPVHDLAITLPLNISVGPSYCLLQTPAVCPFMNERMGIRRRCAHSVRRFSYKQSLDMPPLDWPASFGTYAGHRCTGTTPRLVSSSKKRPTSLADSHVHPWARALQTSRDGEKVHRTNSPSRRSLPCSEGISY